MIHASMSKYASPRAQQKKNEREYMKSTGPNASRTDMASFPNPPKTQSTYAAPPAKVKPPANIKEAYQRHFGTGESGVTAHTNTNMNRFNSETPLEAASSHDLDYGKVGGDAVSWVSRNPGVKFNERQISHLKRAGFDDPAIQRLYGLGDGMAETLGGDSRYTGEAARLDGLTRDADLNEAYLKNGPSAKPPTDYSGPYSSADAQFFQGSAERLQNKRAESDARYREAYDTYAADRDRRLTELGREGGAKEGEELDVGRRTEHDMADFATRYRNSRPGKGFTEWTQDLINNGSVDLSSPRDRNLISLIEKNYGIEFDKPRSEMPLGGGSVSQEPRQVMRSDPGSDWRSIPTSQELLDERAAAASEREARSQEGMARRRERAMLEGDIMSARASAIQRGQNPNVAEAIARRNQAMQQAYGVKADEANTQREHELDLLRQEQEFQGEQAELDRKGMDRSQEAEIANQYRQMATAIVSDPNASPAEKQRALQQLGAISGRGDVESLYGVDDATAMASERISGDGSINDYAAAAEAIPDGATPDQIKKIGDDMGVDLSPPALRQKLNELNEQANEYANEMFRDNFGISGIAADRKRGFLHYKNEFLRRHKKLIDAAKKSGVVSSKLDDVPFSYDNGYGSMTPSPIIIPWGQLSYLMGSE